MSTEINLEKLYNNSVQILSDLIGFRTISGEDNSALINYCENYLHKLGASSFKTFDKEKIFFIDFWEFTKNSKENMKESNGLSGAHVWSSRHG